MISIGMVLSQRGAALGRDTGLGLQMLKADARRKQLRDASDRLEQAWANSNCAD